MLSGEVDDYLTTGKGQPTLKIDERLLAVVHHRVQRLDNLIAIGCAIGLHFHPKSLCCFLGVRQLNLIAA